MSDETQLPVRECSRTYTLEDMTIRSDGDGRTVEAYATVFSTRAEVRDQDGHYYEENDPASFNRTIDHKRTSFGVFYNHARTLQGTPDGTLSVPIGVPLEVRADDHGVWTATRYLDNPLADSVLDGIKQGAIRGQSWSGRFMKSQLVRGARGELPLIRRMEADMREYGPTPFPVYKEAVILGHRSVSMFLDEIAALADEDRDRLRNLLGIDTPLTDPSLSLDTSTEPVHIPADDPALRHSARQVHLSLRAQARKKGGPLT